MKPQISSVILYEHPFNERIRSYLRLEQLFLRLGELARRDSSIDHHYALATIFEIMDMGGRTDLKTDVLKDLEKQKHALNGYRGNPAISDAALDSIIGQLDKCFTGLSQLSGKIGQSLTDDDWLMGIRSRMGIPGGTCAFDLPAYHAWQHLSFAVRQQDLQHWMSSLLSLAEAVRLLLLLLRDSGTPQKVVVSAGKYEQMLPQGRTFQLLRLRLDSRLGLIPEISCNRLMVAVRLTRQESGGRLHISRDDAMFELTLCC